MDNGQTSRNLSEKKAGEKQDKNSQKNNQNGKYKKITVRKMQRFENSQSLDVFPGVHFQNSRKLLLLLFLFL